MEERVKFFLLDEILFSRYDFVKFLVEIGIYLVK